MTFDRLRTMLAAVSVCVGGNSGKNREGAEKNMTDKQYQSILNLITSLIEKCRTEEEIKEAAKLIREVTQNLQKNE